MSTTTRRLRGLAAMLHDAVAHGSTAIQHVHLVTAARPFRILEGIPPVAAPAKLVHLVYDAAVSHTYANVRRVNGLVAFGIELALDAAEEREEPEPVAVPLLAAPLLAAPGAPR